MAEPKFIIHDRGRGNIGWDLVNAQGRPIAMNWDTGMAEKEVRKNINEILRSVHMNIKIDSTIKNDNKN